MYSILRTGKNEICRIQNNLYDENSTGVKRYPKRISRSN